MAEDPKLLRLDEVIEQLGCDPSAHHEVEHAIKGSFDWFRRFDAAFARTNRVAMVASARAIAADITALLTDLETAPEPLRNFLFLPPEARRIATRADIEARPTVAQSYACALLSALRTMQSDCESFLAKADPEPPGPERDRAQRHCLRLAYILMQGFSNRPISGNRDGPLLRLGSLLYEELTGRDPVDLSRHYRDLQRNPPPVTAQSHEEQINQLQARLDHAARDEKT
jgi:hypothetical protein